MGCVCACMNAGMHQGVSEHITQTYLNEVVVNPSPIGQKEAAAGRQAVKEEELLLGTKQAVVPLLGLLHSVLVGLHAVLVWEGDAIHTLHHKHYLDMIN